MKRFIIAFAAAVLMAGCTDNGPDGGVCSNIVGFEADDDNSYWGAEYIVAYQFLTGNADTTVNRLRIKLESAADFIIAVYTDNSLKPGSVVMETGVLSGIVGWNYVGIDDLVLSADTYYWIAVLSSGNGVRCRDDGDAATALYLSYLWTTASSSGMPENQAGWGMQQSELKLCLDFCAY